MKTLMVVLTAAVFPIAAAGESIDSPSSMMAQQYARRDVEEYRGFFNFTRVHENGQEEWVRGAFRMLPDGQVVRFEVDGEVVHDDADNPLPGLPTNAEGSVRDYRLVLFGMEGGEVALQGYTKMPTLQPGDPITVTLSPEHFRTFLYYNPPEGVDPDNLEIDINGNGQSGGYWTRDKGGGGFVLRIDPEGGPVQYRIIDRSTGEVLETGEVSPVDHPEPDDSHPVNIQLAGGVISVDMTRQREPYFKGLDLTGWEETEEGRLPALAFTLTQEDETWLHLRNFNGFIEVREWRPTGEMPLLMLEERFSTPVEPLEEPEKGKSASAPHPASIRLPEEPEKLVVILIGDEKRQSFSVRFAPSGGLG